jgi:hypothetical protein
MCVSAVPSGQVLVGGHAPISTLDTFNFTIPGGFTEDFRNPSFEIYNPPYVYWGPQPTITSVSSNFARGATATVATPDASSIASVVLIRNRFGERIENAPPSSGFTLDGSFAVVTPGTTGGSSAAELAGTAATAINPTASAVTITLPPLTGPWTASFLPNTPHYYPKAQGLKRSPRGLSGANPCYRRHELPA